MQKHLEGVTAEFRCPFRCRLFKYGEMPFLLKKNECLLELRVLVMPVVEKNTGIVPLTTNDWLYTLKKQIRKAYLFKRFNMLKKNRTLLITWINEKIYI